MSDVTMPIATLADHSSIFVPCSVRSLSRSWMFGGTSYGPIVIVELPFSASDS